MNAPESNRLGRLSLTWAACAALLLAATITVTRLATAAEEAGAKLEKPEPPRITLNEKPLVREGKAVASFSPVIKRVAPSVVTVFPTTKARTISAPRSPFQDDPFFRRFFEEAPNRSQRIPRQAGLGSGVIVTEEGYILTNNHVVENADEIKVTLTDGREFPARVIGKDPKTDIAVLKIEATDLPHVEVANSDQLEVGDLVLAIGNPFGVGQTVTMGMVSAMGRATLGLDYEDFIQTDAAINPGNSGGALVDAEGRLVGINTAILSRSGGFQGIGFAVPVNLARSVMDSLVRDGRVVRGFMGVNIQDLTPALAKEFKLKNGSGALVAEVTPRSPAEKAGLKSGDVIVEFNGKPVKDSRQFRLQVAQTPPGVKVPVKLLREGGSKSLEVTLKEFPRAELSARADEGEERTQTETLQGVTVSDLDAAARTQFKLPAKVRGALVARVEEDSASYAAGLREGDVIVEIDRKPVLNAEEAIALSEKSRDEKVLLRVWSRGASRYVIVEEKSKAG